MGADSAGSGLSQGADCRAEGATVYAMRIGHTASHTTAGVLGQGAGRGLSQPTDRCAKGAAVNAVRSWCTARSSKGNICHQDSHNERQNQGYR